MTPVRRTASSTVYSKCKRNDRLPLFPHGHFQRLVKQMTFVEAERLVIINHNNKKTENKLILSCIHKRHGNTAKSDQDGGKNCF